MARRATPLIITHGNCLDGFTAAYAAWEAFDRRIRVFNAMHGGLPPRCAGQVVYILDFSYPREWLTHMYEAARFLKVLDHHVSAIPDIGDLPYVRIDPSRSGASLTWDELVKRPRPYLIDLVEHADTWRWAEDWERDALAWLEAEPRTFTNWAELATWSKADWEAIARDGKVLRKPYLDDIEWHFQHRRHIELTGVKGFAVEGPAMLRSDLGNRMAEASQTFGLVWQKTPGAVYCSLRSCGFDTLPIAKHYGGGGHHTASAFRLSYAEAASLIPGFS